MKDNEMSGQDIFKKNELVETIKKEHPDLSKKEINQIIDTIFDEIVKNCMDGKAFTQNNFGRFEYKVRASRKGRNKSTGEIIDIPEANVIKFHLSKTLFKKINKK